MKKLTPPATAAAGDIRPAVAAVAKVVKKNAPKVALQCAKVGPVGRGKIRLTGADAATFFTAEIPGEVPAKFEPFLVPVDQLKDLVRGAKAHERVALRPDRNAADETKFPATPKFRAAPVELGEEAKVALLRAFACASTDESRQVLQSAYLDVGAKGGCRIIGTDGRHLFASRPMDIPGLRDPVILPSLKVLGSPLVKRSPAWELRVASSANGSGGRLFRLTGENWDLTGHLAEGNYPAYRQVIPHDREFKTRIAFPDAAIPSIVSAVKRMPGSRMQNRPVGLRAGKGLTLLAREDEQTPFEGLEVPADVGGKSATVFLNRDYLLKAFAFGLHDVSAKDEMSPVKFAGKAGTMIAMPVRIAGEIEVARTETLGRIPRRRSNPPPQRKPMPNQAPPPSQRKPEPKRNPMPPPVPPKPSPNGGSEPDPMDAAAGQIANVKEALRSAMSAVNDIAATLKATQKRQRQTEKEMRSVRHTLRSLRKVEL